MNLIIDNTPIGKELPSYLIAEIGLNHNHNLDIAYEMIDKAIESGANAVKFQVYKTENLMLESSPAYPIFKELELTKEEIVAIKKHCDQKKITFFASTFCKETTDFMASLQVSAFKIASMDINNYDLIEYIASKQKPVVLSTGMASLHEIVKAVETIKRVNQNLILLHCVSKYPPEYDEMNLRMVSLLKTMFPELAIGLSDHTLDTTASCVARVLGAEVFERHFTLDRTMEGPDQSISLDPKQFSSLRDNLDKVDQSLQKRAEAADGEIALHARRSIFATRAIAKGEAFSVDMLKCVRPGTGLAPEFASLFIGKKANQDIKEDTALQLSMI